MRVNYLQSAVCKTIEFKSKKKTGNFFNLHQLKTDVFQKTASKFDVLPKTDCLLGEAEINKLYDEVFDEILEDIPILKELGAKKPKLVLRDDITSRASYDFPSNTIELNAAFKGDLYAYQVCDEVGAFDCEIGFEDVKKLTKLKMKSAKFDIIKLNSEEKELYLKSILAHELRHWAQEHITISTKGCQEPYYKKLQIANELMQIIEELAMLTKISPKQVEKPKLDLEYILNYKPKVVLDEDYKLSVLVDESQKRYWSIKKHFLPASLRYSNSDEKEYATNPTEIDAYCYQAEFLLSNKNKSLNVRNDVFGAMIVDSIEKGWLFAKAIEQFGYPPLLAD